MLYLLGEAKMKYSRLVHTYPNIIDMIKNPVFRERHNMRINLVCAFWNMLGARGCNLPKFTCEICGTPIRKRTPRKYMVCKHCLHKYVQDVRWGNRKPIYYVPKVAVN